ncbi:MAG: hypothetical protein ABIQ86_16550 [Steroidobacteraceae bacterium]
MSATFAATEVRAAIYAPAELADGRTKLDQLHGAYREHDYELIQRDGPDLLRQIRVLATLVAKNEEAAVLAEWTALDMALQRMHEHMATWLKSARPSPGALTKEDLQAFARDLEAARNLLLRATEAHAADPDSPASGLNEARDSAVRTLILLDRSILAKRKLP